MATRCTIKIEGITFAKIYKHWDGCPENMIEWLTEFNKNFSEKRDDDPEYRFAQLLRFSSKYASKYGLDASETTGWGVVTYHESYGADYEYTLHCDGSVTYQRGESNKLSDILN